MICGGRFKRNGKTVAGKQRFRCLNCGASSSGTRADVSRRAELEAFLAWLLGKKSQTEITGTLTGRSFRRRTQWCWRIEPVIPVTGEIYDQVQIDGIYLGSWSCLIAISGEHVMGWQWCDTEKKVAWAALLARFPPPLVVITDGGSGLASALKEQWPQTLMQRCLVHVARNVRTYLTNRPRTEAGKALLRLSKALTRLASIEEATAWMRQLNTWYSLHGKLVKERTYRGQNTAVPSWVRPTQRWWFTHDRLRKAYRLLERLTHEGFLFTYLEPEHANAQIASSTNRIEGGINTGIRYLLRHHRGMPTEHQKRAVEWFLYTRSENPLPPTKLIRPEHHNPAKKPTRFTPKEEPPGPALYDNHTTTEEGLWTRKGWAGRP